MRRLNLNEITLLKGSHKANGHFCVMELAAYIAEEPWSDRPACVSPAIGAFLRTWNDSLDDEQRQMLKPYAIACINTTGTQEQEEQRAWMATDWLVRECVPAFLRLAGLTSHAETLEHLAALSGTREATNAQPHLVIAWDAAGWSAATWDAAAWDAVWSAAAGNAAWSAAAWNAPRAHAAEDAAWDVARRAAAVAAAGAARAVRDAARKLQPTVKILQARALLLLDRMIAVTATSRDFGIDKSGKNET